MARFFNRYASFIIILTVFLFLPSRAFSESGLPKFTKNEDSSKVTPIQVRGDAVEYFHEDQKAVGTGHVSIDYEDIKLTADKITVYMATKNAIAEGHVKLVQKGSVFTGERAEFNFGTKIGNVSQMSAEIAPNYYGKAQKVERVSDNHYRTVDSYITTCCGDNPFYKIQAHQVDIYPEEKVVARNAILYIHNVPVLFVPYFVVYMVDFDRFPVQVIPGKNSEWGAFLLSKWRYTLVSEPTFQDRGNILLDYRTKRGIGGGIENYYKGDKVGRGSLKYYYANDNEPTNNASSNRYRAQWRHQANLGEDTTLTAEVNKLSDATIIKDFFFREEYERDVSPDNYVSIITAKPEYTLSILDREQLNDFDNVVTRSPEVRFDTHTRRFADTPFYLRQETQFANLKKKFADMDDDEAAIRADTKHTLYYGARIGSVSVTPRIGTEQTYYSRNLEGDKTSFVRGTFDGGVDVSTKFYKTYDVYIDKYGFDYNQIRHIFTPTASYNYRPNPTVDRTTLIQFDAIDAVDKQNFIRFDFENKLQTKEHNQSGSLVPRDIARLIPFFDVDLHKGTITNVGGRAELRPYSWLGIEGDTTFNTTRGIFDTANVDFFIERSNYRFAIGQRYVEDSSSQMTAQVNWKINQEWEVKVYDRFEFKQNHSEEFEFTLSKAFDCFIADLTYNHRYEGGDTYYVAFRLKAFPKSSFGLSQSYNHPKIAPEQAI